MSKFPGSLIGGLIETSAQGLIAGAMNKGVAKADSYLNKSISSIEGKLGIGLGRTDLNSLLTDPLGSLSDVFVNSILGKSQEASGWYTLITNRADPLLEIDWIPIMPFSLPMEYVEEIQWSHPSFDTDAVFRNGKMVNVISGQSTPPISVRLYEDVNLTAQTWATNWYNLIYDPRTGTYAYPATYKQPMAILFRNIERQEIGRVLFGGCVPTALPSINSGSDSSNRVQATVQLAVDTMIFETTGVKSAAHAQGAASGTVLDNLISGVSSSASSWLGGAVSSVISGLFK